jgi:hypothetical protein
MITIIFSKDRALQLDLLLRSIKENNKENLNIHVLYKCSNERHEKSYEILAKEHPEATLHKEVNFKQDLLDLILHEMYILFMVDDNIVARKFNTNEMIGLLNYHPTAIGFSLRLGGNTNYCYSLNCNQNIPPSIQLKENIFMCNWVNAEADWNYPFELSSSMYRTKDIQSMLINLDYYNPNSLEWMLYTHSVWHKERQPLLMFYGVSPCFCNPINKVNPSNNRSNTNIENSADSLLTNFEKCGRISYDKFRGFVSNACHQEVDINIIYKEM